MQASDVPSFHGQTAARLLDTRLGLATVDAQFAGIGPIAAGETVSVTVLGRGGVPSSGVGAVALNVTVTNPTGAGFLSVYPSGVPRPYASNVNFGVGQTIANMALVPVSADGQVVLFNSGGSTDVVIDVLGWFPSGSSFTGLTPARVLESRSGLPTVDGFLSGVGALGARAIANVGILGRGGVPLSGVSAVVLNVTVTEPTSAGYLAVFPAGGTLPATSNLNFAVGQTVANMVVVPVDANGLVSILNASGGTAEVVADVLGWLPIGASFSGLTPSRLMDSRVAHLTTDGRFGGGGALGPGNTFNLVIAGRAGMPTGDLGAVALNVTVTNPTSAGFVTIFPQGAARPLASNLNVVAGQTIANMVIVPVGHSGQVSIFNSAGNSDVIVDVLGWFPNPTIPATSYGVDLVLKSDGIGTALFGDPAEPSMTLFASVLGAPAFDSVEFHPYRGPPYLRYACFTNGPCVTFEGYTSSTLIFTGWSAFGSGERLLDANGLAIGARGSDFPGAITVIGTIYPGTLPCSPALPGQTASGIHLALTFHGTVPASVSSFTPAQHEVTIETMSAGAPLYGGRICV